MTKGHSFGLNVKGAVHTTINQVLLVCLLLFICLFLSLSDPRDWIYGLAHNRWVFRIPIWNGVLWVRSQGQPQGLPSSCLSHSVDWGYGNVSPHLALMFENTANSSKYILKQNSKQQQQNCTKCRQEHFEKQ